MASNEEKRPLLSDSCVVCNSPECPGCKDEKSTQVDGGRRIVRYEILKYECCHTFMCGQLIQKRVQEKSQIVKLVARRLRKVSFNNMLFIDLYPEGMKVHIFKLRTF